LQSEFPDLDLFGVLGSTGRGYHVDEGLEAAVFGHRLPELREVNDHRLKIGEGRGERKRGGDIEGSAIVYIWP
jgi:hypothetical protein